MSSSIDQRRIGPTSGVLPGVLPSRGVRVFLDRHALLKLTSLLLGRQNVNHLCRLPVELLDLIFEFAASTLTLTARPVSKGLLRSQERAIYQTIIFRAARNTTRFRHTVEARPDKGQLARRLVWKVPGVEPSKPHRERILRQLPNLVEMGFDVNDEASLTLFRNEPDLLQFVPSLRICRLPNTFLNFWTVKWLSQIPTLRLVEIDWIRPSTYKMDYDDDRWIPATQVLHVAIRFECRVPTPAQLLQCFPSASFSSVPVLVFEDSNILSLFASLSHGLVSLRLRGSKPDLSSKSIDHLLPQFSNLRHLYLDPAFTSERLQSYLLDVPKLVTLGLGYYEQDLDLDELLSGLGRLPHLWKLTRAYLGIDGSHKYFDFDEAEEEWTHETWMYKINHDTLSLLQNVDDLSDMTDFDLPWRETLSDTLQEVIDLEDKVRAAGLTVEINLSELVQGLGFQIVECYNRAVGDLYYNGRLQPLKYALSIAEKHGFDINRLEISLEEDIDCDKLKWFKDRVGGTGLVAGCYVYGLRFKTDLECYGTEEEEEESDESDQGSGGEHENE